jgi:uncharacterized protein
MTSRTPTHDGASAGRGAGAVRWADLSTPDVEAATRFYAELFGWSIEPHPSPFGPYYIGTAGRAEVAGMMQQDPDQPDLAPAWTVFVEVADVDDCLAAVERAGGAVLEPAFDLPDARIAVVRDPTGAVLGLIAGQAAEGSWLTDAPGSVCWTELLTRDPATAERFYVTVFGWEADTTEHDGSRYTTFLLDGEAVAGMMAMPVEVPAAAPASWGPYFSVPDCEAAERRAEALGGLVLRPTTDLGGQRFAVLADPTGATFQVLEHRR